MSTVVVRFMSLAGTFTRVRTESFPSSSKALAAVEAYAAAGGYRGVRTVDDDDPGTFRYVATTPGGRGGRNVAFGEFDDCYGLSPEEIDRRGLIPPEAGPVGS